MGWARKISTFLGPKGTREPLPMPRVMMLHSSKPLSISAIKTTGTLVVLCTRVLLCTVVVCCVLEGWGGLLVAVLCEQVFRWWGLVGRAPPPPPTIHGSLLVGGGCYSYIRFDPSLAVS
jgi:hypothetical protein